MKTPFSMTFFKNELKISRSIIIYRKKNLSDVHVILLCLCRYEPIQINNIADESPFFLYLRMNITTQKKKPPFSITANSQLTRFTGDRRLRNQALKVVAEYRVWLYHDNHPVCHPLKHTSRQLASLRHVYLPAREKEG